MLAALARTAHTPVIKPWPLRPAVEGGFTIDDFTVDEAAGTVTCPRNITRAITVKRRVTFGAACTGCPFRARCTTSPRGTQARSPRTRHVAANTANAPRIRLSRTTTAPTGPWSSGPSPGSPAGTAAFPNAASAGTTPGCSYGSRGLKLRRLLTLGLTVNEESWALG